MAVREFRDAAGRRWRAWDIKPEEVRPITRAEDYLADCYVTGWIVFETVSGTEKRRLCPWPKRWTDESEWGLRKLLAKAERVPPMKLSAERQTIGGTLPTGDVEVPLGYGEFDITDLEVIRTFRYPGGRLWTVTVLAHPEPGLPPVLRFTSGARFFDLRRWPKDWADEPNDHLAELLRNAAPRPAAAPEGPDSPRRRWNDRPANA